MSAATMAYNLQVDRVFNAPIERVFAAWTDPAKLRHWFAPEDGLETDAELDLRVGGTYRFTMRSSSVHGKYTEINPPNKLVFTWRWDHEASDNEMLITVELRPHQDGGTRLILTHERLPNAEQRDSHASGWNRNLSRLEHLLTT